MQVTLTLDTTVPVTEGAREIVKTLLEAIGLVMLVVFIFLQSWRATLIPILTIPVSLVGAFMFFPAVGFSVNTLSLLGLVLAVGLVVDDAIVVVEAIEAKIEQGQSPRDAALEAMDEVGGALVGIALVLSAVFIPAGFMAGITGSLYRQFALTIAFSVIISAFNALTLSPALGALLLRPRSSDARAGPARAILRRCSTRLRARAQRLRQRLRSAHPQVRAWRSRSWSASRCSRAESARSLPQSFLPDEDQGYFFMNVELPEAASLQRTIAVMRKIDEILKHRARRALRQRDRRLQPALADQRQPQRSVLLSADALSTSADTPALQAARDRRVGESQARRAARRAGRSRSCRRPFPASARPAASTSSSRTAPATRVDYLWQNTQKFLAAAHKRPELGAA